MNTEELFEVFAKLLGTSVTQLKMRMATPDKLLQDIVKDNRRDVHSPSSVAARPNERAEEIVRGSGWQEAPALGPPPGIGLVDQIAEGFEKRERRGG